MHPAMLIGAAIGVVLLLTFPTLTAVGARRRGLSAPLAIGAGLVFPLTWVVWYVRDERPYRRHGLRPRGFSADENASG